MTPTLIISIILITGITLIAVLKNKETKKQKNIYKNNKYKKTDKISF